LVDWRSLTLLSRPHSFQRCLLFFQYVLMFVARFTMGLLAATAGLALV
jgi:hypothetical protein